MAGLQRCEVSFRRQGSSGLVWDEKLLNSNQIEAHQQQKHNQICSKKTEQELIKEDSASAVGLTIERSRSNGGRGFRAGKVSPAIDPPSPRVSACGFCGTFGKKNNTRRRPFKSGKRVV